MSKKKIIHTQQHRVEGPSLTRVFDVTVYKGATQQSGTYREEKKRVWVIAYGLRIQESWYRNGELYAVVEEYDEGFFTPRMEEIEHALLRIQHTETMEDMKIGLRLQRAQNVAAMFKAAERRLKSLRHSK